MNEGVQVLSCTFEHLYITDWKIAISDVFIGRAEVIEEHFDRFIGVVDGLIPMPKIVRLKRGISPTKLAASRNMKYAMKFSREALYVRDEGKCQYCEKKLSKSESTVDHVLPRSRGGTTTWENCVVCCSSCNTRKSNLTTSEIGMELLKVPTKPRMLYCTRTKK